MSEEARTQQSNPWKIATIAIVSSVVAALASGVVVAQVTNAKHDRADEATLETPLDAETPESEELAEQAEPVPVVIVQQQPAPRPAPMRVLRLNCQMYRPAADRKGGVVEKDSVLGAAVGAGLGAASGAIVDGGSGAGKGAGVGAIVGLAGGTLYGLNQENQRTQAARNAYHACKARQS